MLLARGIRKAGWLKQESALRLENRADPRGWVFGYDTVNHW
jgi:hypothetical protein